MKRARLKKFNINGIINKISFVSSSCRVLRSQIRSLEGWGSGRRCRPWCPRGPAAGSASTPGVGAATACTTLRQGRTAGPWSRSTRQTAAHSASCPTGRPYPQVREREGPKYWDKIIALMGKSQNHLGAIESKLIQPYKVCKFI